MSATLKELSDRLTAIVPHVPPMCRIEAKFIAAEMRSIEARPESVKPHTGTRLLTRDLVWCECGRGLSTAGVWTYCPRCGHPIDQEAYQGACEAAARLRGFVIEGDEFLRDKIAILAAEAAPVLTTATPLPVLRDNGGSNFCLKCHAEFGSEHPLCCDEGTTANGSINGVCAKCCDGRLHGKDEDAPVPESAGLVEALRAMLTIMDRGVEPKKFDESLTWRQNDEKARAMAVAALAAYESRSADAL